MQLVSSRIWTHVAVSISYDDNHYTTFNITSSNLILYSYKSFYIIKRHTIHRSISLLHQTSYSTYMSHWLIKRHTIYMSNSLLLIRPYCTYVSLITPLSVIQHSCHSVLVFNWNHFEMRFLNLRINFYLLRTFCPHHGSFLCCFFFHYVSAKFHLWPSSCDLPRPRIGMMSLVTVSPVNTAFHSRCLSHNVKFGRNVVKEETTQKLPTWGKKSAINKN